MGHIELFLDVRLVPMHRHIRSWFDVRLVPSRPVPSPRIMACAAKVAVAQIREVVELDELDPEAIITPGYFRQAMPDPGSSATGRDVGRCGMHR
jgi:hypothetical protein